MTGGVSGWTPLWAGMIGAVVGWLLLLGVGTHYNVLKSGADVPTTSKTPSEIVRTMQSQTSMEAERLSQRHLGLALTVEGRVSDIERRSAFDIVVHVVTTDETSAFLHFALRHEPALRALDKLDWIRARGQIAAVSPNWISLERCELLSQATNAPGGS